MLAIHELTRGSGIPLVFLHGFLGSSKDWIPVCAALKGRTCIGVDLPGHGDSPFTEQFDEALLSIEPPFHLIGYSMGGRLAMGFASRYPNRIAALILLSAHTGLPENERSERLKIDQTWAQALLELPIDEFLNRWYDQPIFKTLDQKRMRTMRRQQNVSSLAKALVHYSLGRQPIYDPKGYFLVGELDAKFRDHYRDRNPLVIAQAGHAIHLEKPADVAHHMERLL